MINRGSNTLHTDVTRLHFDDSLSLLSLSKLQGAMRRFAHLENSSLNFLSSSSVIRVNLLHP